tara:strand:- start:5361 stop:5474 length:114 start_codon:yes stop_codon:yes gene_type:complete
MEKGTKETALFVVILLIFAILVFAALSIDLILVGPEL